MKTYSFAERVCSALLSLLLVLFWLSLVSCAKKDELKDGKVSYTIVNNTGKNVTEITLSDRKSDNKVESKPEEGGMPDGDSIGLELPVKLENDTTADVMFGYTVEGGDSMTAPVTKLNGTITLKITDGEPASAIVKPAEWLR